MKTLEEILFNKDFDYEVFETLIELGRFSSIRNQLKKAQSLYNQPLDISTQVSIDVDRDQKASKVLNDIGCCLMIMDRPEEARYYLEKSLLIDKQLLVWERDIAVTLHELGCCSTRMDDHENAKDYLKKALEIKLRTSVEIDSALSVSLTLRELGYCFPKMNKIEEAKHCSDRSQQIINKHSSLENKIAEIAK